uniref:Zinc knuckle CX2CX4HX4C domain-containing protein n=1 Tax=Chenopodium quinoa TaxID=63459 RepID=A0A803MXP4_CHEQI
MSDWSCVKSMNFDGAYLWVRVEGLPVHYSTVSIASRVLSRIGRVLYFDSESLRPLVREAFRAKVWLSLNRPLIPGFYFEFEQGSFEWVDLRYEGVFVLCKTCGRIGHKENYCKLCSRRRSREFQAAMYVACDGSKEIRVDPTYLSLYTNKIMGLKRVEKNRTLKLNLIEIKNSRESREFLSVASSPSVFEENDKLENDKLESLGLDKIKSFSPPSPNSPAWGPEPDSPILSFAQALLDLGLSSSDSGGDYDKPGEPNPDQACFSGSFSPKIIEISSESEGIVGTFVLNEVPSLDEEEVASHFKENGKKRRNSNASRNGKGVKLGLSDGDSFDSSDDLLEGVNKAKKVFKGKTVTEGKGWKFQFPRGSQTKCSTSSLVPVFARIGYKEHFGVDASVEASGGFFLCWSCKLVVISSSPSTICCKEQDDLNNVIYMSFVYGSPYLDWRMDVWKTLDDFLNTYEGLHLLVGDFNQVEWSSQKRGGNNLIRGALDFTKWRLNHGLTEIPHKGVDFTWTNNRLREDNVMERLDRAYCNLAYKDQFPEALL